MRAVYNEIEKYPADWLRNLEAAGHIAPGDVLEGDIRDIDAETVRGRPFHSFAGIGVWSLALRMAGVPDDYPAWTGSCPCQPFSVAGLMRGEDDERHLFPAWLRLIDECRPPVIFGEQVASPSGRDWLDNVSASLEALGYAFGSADLCAASVGAPHVRSRLWFGAVRLANADVPRPQGRLERRQGASERASGPSGVGGWMADADEERRPIERLQLREWQPRQGLPETTGDGENGYVEVTGVDSGATGGFWEGSDWLLCRDAKVRPVEPGTFPLADGPSDRVGRLRAYGNAIVPQVASVFIQSFLEAVRQGASEGARDARYS